MRNMEVWLAHMPHNIHPLGIICWKLVQTFHVDLKNQVKNMKNGGTFLDKYDDKECGLIEKLKRE